jgi:hypothetical protein
LTDKVSNYSDIGESGFLDAVILDRYRLTVISIQKADDQTIGKFSKISANQVASHFIIKDADLR